MWAGVRSCIIQAVGGVRSRTAAAGAVALALLGGSAALAAAERGGATVSAKGAGAKVLTSSQRNALRLGYVRVRVSSRAGGTLRVAARARRTGGGSTRRVTRVRRIRLRRAGAASVRLPLTRPGRRILGSCRGLVLDASGRRGRKRFGSRPRALARDARHCRSAPARAPAGEPGRGVSDPPGGPPLGELNTENADRCDFLDPSLCLYPFPNDRFTVADAEAVTGRRLNLDPDSVPKNRLGKPIDPTDQNRADGFSPGNLIVTRVPGLDSKAAFGRTGAVPITDMERSFDPGQPVVVINARTRERQLIWAEIDSNPQNKEDVTLIVRPGRNLLEGERYIVALRNLKDAEGNVLKPREEFRAYRDGITTRNGAIEGRRPHFEDIFKTLGAAGIAREDLYLAWDFTVASRESLAGRALDMRDDAFEQLGDTDLADLEVQGTAPQFVQNPDLDDDAVDGLDGIDTDPVPKLFDFGDFDGLREYPPCSAGAGPECEQGESDQTARRVTGQITVPCYLNAPGCPRARGSRAGRPAQTAGQHRARERDLHRAAQGGRRRRATGGLAALALRPRPARQCGRGGRRQRAGDGAASTTSSSAPPTGWACRPSTSRTWPRCCRTCPASPRSSTGSSRAT